MTGSIEERFQNLHEFVTQARTNLNRNNWDHLIGGSVVKPMERAAPGYRSRLPSPAPRQHSTRFIDCDHRRHRIGR